MQTKRYWSISIVIPTVEIKKYLSLKYNYFCSKNMAKINLSNPSDLASTNGIEFDEKLKQKIEIYIQKYEQVKKQLKDIQFNNYNYNQKRKK